jgi:WD40-like Beta Propeller Repeat
MRSQWPFATERPYAARMMRDAIRVLAICCALAACGGNNSGDDDETGATLRIDPQTTELLILNNVPAKQPYTATLVFPDGREQDVTASTLFTVDAAYGEFAESTVSIRTAGKTAVYGQHNAVVGNAQILARLKSERVDPALPPNTPDLFSGAEDPARAPTVVYPAVDVVMPRNLGDFETHWIDATGNDIFEVSLKTEFADVRVYVPGGNGNAAAGPMASFQAFLAAEWLAAVGLEPQITYQVRGVSTANPGPVGAGPPRIVRLSNETMEGGLYYWAAASTNNVYGIYRHDMAHPGQPAEEFMTTVQTSGRCVACHALSRDGKKMAITYDGGDGAGTTIDVATSARSPDIAPWNFATYNPDGSQLVTVSRGQITVRDAATGAALAVMPSSNCVSHPDVSADGTRLVYISRPEVPDVTGTCPVADWSFNGGKVYTRSFDPVTHAFGAEQPLVTQGVNNFYPSWSPDGQWILFNRADSGGSYNNANANMFVIKSDGSGPEIPLTTANQALALTNSWGRWAPFQQTVGAMNDTMFWITVSSKRDFGVRLVGAQRPQIWMTPFFLGKANAAVDPTVAAFRLPFQNIESNNHIAQWTERVVTTQ